MVKAQAGILETDDAATAEAKLRRAVRDLVADPREAEWVEGHVRPLLALDAPAGERREDAFAAWRRLFEALADGGRSCWWSKTSTGRTRACSTSSTIWPTGRRVRLSS